MKKIKIVTIFISSLLFLDTIMAKDNYDYIVRVSNYEGKFVEAEIDGQYYLAIPIKELKNVHFSRVSHYMGGGDLSNECAVMTVCLKCCAGDKKIPKQYCKNKYPKQNKDQCNCE